MASLLVGETEVSSPRQEAAGFQEHGQAVEETPLDGSDAEDDDDEDDEDDEKNSEQDPALPLDDSQALFSGFLKKKGEQRRVRCVALLR